MTRIAVLPESREQEAMLKRHFDHCTKRLHSQLTVDRGIDRVLAEITDAEAAAVIRADEIDILIDLAGPIDEGKLGMSGQSFTREYSTDMYLFFQLRNATRTGADFIFGLPRHHWRGLVRLLYELESPKWEVDPI